MKSREDLVEKLMKENEDFASKYRAHRDYKKKVEELDKRSHLTPEEEVEKARLKKLKLALKDEMETMLAHYRRRHH